MKIIFLLLFLLAILFWIIRLEKLFISNKLDSSFVFPYSTDKEIKRQQIWNNLQKGILFEDTQVFIPWLTPYYNLNKHAEQREESGDRIYWFLGRHKIFDGYSSSIEVMKYIYVNHSTPFSKIEEFLGFDKDGNEKFIMLKEKLINLLGEPTIIELEKFGDRDLGSIEWTKDNARVSLIGFEQFACKYWLHIGLKKNDISS